MTVKESMIRLPSQIELHTIVSETKTPSNKPTLLLLHFWGGSNRTYHALADQLQARYNIVAPSLRGWGKSHRPAGRNAYGIASYVDDITNLVQSIQTSHPHLLVNGIVVVGHSMGGKIAQVLLAQSQLVHIIRALVLVAPAPSGGFSLDQAMREQQVHAYESLESARFVVENVLIGRPTTIDEVELEAIATDAFAGSEEAKEAWPAYGMAEDYEEAVTSALKGRPRWKGADLAVLVMVGELDRVETPVNVETRVSNVLKNAEVRIKTQRLQNVGHLIPLEVPLALAAAIEEFVGELSNE